MAKYYEKLSSITDLSTKSGSNIEIEGKFFELSAKIINKCSYFQKIMQDILYDTHGEEVYRAAQKLKDLSSPNKKFEFLNSDNNIVKDQEISVIFRYTKAQFIELYDLRNCLAHEIWHSSQQLPNQLLLSRLDEEAKIIFARRKLEYVESNKTIDTYHSIIRYIENFKVVSISNLHQAHHDIELCNWCLLQISFFLRETDPQKALSLKEGFFIFGGVSHLFPGRARPKETMSWESKTKKSREG
ncbi:hypothetical protein [Sphingomonas parapaucimobilis]|uniref:Uncharacterized protein n=1 Tax=Sphingomonas parapaucimobilis NBRC 15100 TaxID=1219049 RepID=A0A0A1W367_9SPHN|nr:hypothetical protein [Sphingomonas parapaucimobilis]GAL99864.1 hypothetical protein SP5_015_00290 [Sphingomonas parapaucimobilis NBRC 15100]